MTAANLLPRRHFQSTLNFPPSSSLWQSSSKPTKPKDGKSSRREYRHSFDNRTRLPARLDRHIAHPHRRREAPGRAACGNCPTVEVPAAKITIVETSAGQRSRCDGHKKGDCIGPLYVSAASQFVIRAPPGTRAVHSICRSPFFREVQEPEPRCVHLPSETEIDRGKSPCRLRTTIDSEPMNASSL